MSTSDDWHTTFNNRSFLFRSMFDTGDEGLMEAPADFIKEYKNPKQQDTPSSESESTSSETNKPKDDKMESTAESQYEVIKDA